MKSVQLPHLFILILIKYYCQQKLLDRRKTGISFYLYFLHIAGVTRITTQVKSNKISTHSLSPRRGVFNIRLSVFIRIPLYWSILWYQGVIPRLCDGVRGSSGVLPSQQPNYGGKSAINPLTPFQSFEFEQKSLFDPSLQDRREIDMFQDSGRTKMCN